MTQKYKTVYVEKLIHKKLKALAVQRESTIYKEINNILMEWFKQYEL